MLTKFLFLFTVFYSANAYAQVSTQQVGDGERYSRAYKQARKSVKQFSKTHKVKLEASYARVKQRLLDKIAARADKGFTTLEHKLGANEERATYIIKMAQEDKDFNGFYFAEFGITGEENSGIKMSWPNDVPDELEEPTLPVEPEVPAEPTP